MANFEGSVGRAFESLGIMTACNLLSKLPVDNLKSAIGGRAVDVFKEMGTANGYILFVSNLINNRLYVSYGNKQLQGFDWAKSRNWLQLGIQMTTAGIFAAVIKVAENSVKGNNTWALVLPVAIVAGLTPLANVGLRNYVYKRLDPTTTP